VSPQLCVVPDLDDELTAALSLLDEALSQLAGWIADRVEIDGQAEPPTWPAPLADRSAVEAFARVAGVLRATQGIEGRLRWIAPDGIYEHVPLRFVHLDESDLDTLAAAAHELGRALHPGAGASDELDQALETAGDAAGVSATDVVSTLARLHGLLTLAPTDDCTRLYAAAQRAIATDEHHLELTAALEVAYQRTVGRLNGMWTLGDPLARFVY
jgi:hypothetical protein